MEDVEDVEDVEDGEVVEDVEDVEGVGEAADAARDGAAPPASDEVEVAVLGPVRITGAARTITRRAAVELVVYLAFHRMGARTDEWATALWPDRTVAPSTLHSTASVARRSLGRTAAGSDHLPHGRGKLRLAPSVVTDVDQFRALARSDRVGDWWSALRLVRGRPFEGLTLSDWTVLEGVNAEVEDLVSGVALRTAASCLHAGRGDDAARAVRIGLRACPFDERLYRALLMASESKGDRLGLRSTMEELVWVAAGGSAGPARGPQRGQGQAANGLAALHPQTVALYRELAAGRFPAVGGRPVRL